MDLRDALGQITEIRENMAQGRVFRGYRSLTVGSVGMLAVAAAVSQPYLVPSPADQVSAYLTLWVGVAVVAFGLVAVGLWRRVRITGSPMVRQATILSAEQFLPCVVVGALVTLGIYLGARDAAWMLPGLWSLVFSLGVFALHRQLPKPVFWVGVYFAMCGLACLLWGNGAHAFSPWQMGVSFGGGKLMGAAILYWTLERNHDAPEENG